jgi:hypothetical protein
MPYAEEELKIYLLELDVTVGRININSKCSASKFTCKKAGCGKEFRVIRLFDMPEDNDDEDSIYIEEEVNSLHDHTAAEIHLRGLSVAQKVIVLQCYQRKQSGAKAIIAEFEETARRQRAINGAVVATPKESYRWSKDGSIQKRNIHDVFVNVTENNDHLTDHRAQRFITIFSDFSFASYDEYTSVSNNVSILRRDDTRQEGYNCTCHQNANEFFLRAFTRCCNFTWNNGSVVRYAADRGYAAHRSRIPRSSSEFCTTTHLQRRSSQTQFDDLC